MVWYAASAVPLNSIGNESPSGLKKSPGVLPASMQNTMQRNIPSLGPFTSARISFSVKYSSHVASTNGTNPMHQKEKMAAAGLRPATAPMLYTAASVMPPKLTCSASMPWSNRRPNGEEEPVRRA